MSPNNTKATSDTNDVKPLAKRGKKVMTLMQKVELLDKLASGMNASSVGRLFHINESTVRYIKKNEKQIRDSVANSLPANAKTTGMVRDRVLVKMEKALSDWITEIREQNVAVDSNVIRGRALSLYDHFRTTQRVVDNTKHTFNASRGWYINFKRKLRFDFDCPNSELDVESDLIDHNGRIKVDSTGSIPVKSDWTTVEQVQNDDDWPIPEPECSHNTDSNAEAESRKSDWTLDSMAEVIAAVNTLTDLMGQYDPDVERSLKIQQDIKNAVLPYSDIYKDLQTKTEGNYE